MNTQPRHDVPAWHPAMNDGGPYLVRDDGATVECIAMSRGYEQIFRYTDNALNFEFSANRWDHDLNKPSSSYIVRLHSARIPKPSQALAMTHLKEIETALLSMPFTPGTPPVEKVIFDKSGRLEPPSYLRLREAQHG